MTWRENIASLARRLQCLCLEVINKKKNVFVVLSIYFCQMYYSDPLHSKSGINVARINFLLDNVAIGFAKNPQKLQFSVLSKIRKRYFSTIISAKKTPWMLEEDNMCMKYLIFPKALTEDFFHHVLRNYLSETENTIFAFFFLREMVK